SPRRRSMLAGWTLEVGIRYRSEVMTPWSTARCSHWLGRIPRRPAGRSNDVATELSRLLAPTMAVSLYGRAGGLVLLAAPASGRHSSSILKDFGSWRARFLHTSGLRGAP